MERNYFSKTIKNSYFLIFVFSFLGLTGFAQVGIGTTTPQGALDIVANNDGLLIPRIALTNTNIATVTTPTESELVYNTATINDVTPGYYYWNGTQWIRLSVETDNKNWLLAGNTVNASTDFMGSTNNTDVIFRRNNTRAGRLGANNTSFGTNALNPATTGNYNTASGVGSLYSNTTGNNNTAFGISSLFYNTTGNNNTGIGYQSLFSNTSGSYNVAIGNDALKANLTGSDNLALGSGALMNNSAGAGNTAFGNDALYYTTANNNLGIGRRALYNNQTGEYNTGIGYLANVGANNLVNATAIGSFSLVEASNSLVLGSINGIYGATASTKVGIGTTSPNALLEIKAVNPVAPTNTEGLLIPRMSVFPATNPVAAQQGMLVFLTNAVGTKQPGFYYWDNPTTSWIGIAGANTTAWNLNGNTVNAINDFMGSTNDADVIFKRNNTRAGRIGANNVSLGINALNTATTGSWNAAVGGSALLSNTTGSSNTAVGDDAARGNTTGGFNTALGSRALRNNTTGNDNIAIGYQALESNNANENVAIGNHALQNTTIGYQNTAIGTNALLSNTTGYENSATGLNALRSNTTGRWLTANGAYALRSNTTGEGSTAVGVTALENNTTGNRNIAIGQAALRNNNTGHNNIGIGYNALVLNTIGNGNVAIGQNALASATNVNYDNARSASTAVGDEALRYATGNRNTAVGCFALRNSTSAIMNVAVGDNSLRTNTTGTGNTAIGSVALLFNETGSKNTALGLASLRSNVDDENTSIGAYAHNLKTTGTGNTALGYNSHWQATATGNYNTTIGHSAGGSITNTINNVTVIGYNAGWNSTASNEVNIGNMSVTRISGQVNWSTYSDARIKDNVKEEVKGLSFIKKLRPVIYNINMDKEEAIANEGFVPKKAIASSDNGKEEVVLHSKKISYPEERDIEKIVQSGFLAQEVEQAAKESGYNFSGVQAPKNGKGLYSLAYAEFVVPLVKAVQEQQVQIEKQQKEIDELKIMINELKNK